MASSLCDLDDGALYLICEAVTSFAKYADEENTLLSLSSTCKQLRGIAASFIFHTIMLWNWDTLAQKAAEMARCELIAKYTRTLQLTPVLLRPVSKDVARVHNHYLPPKLPTFARWSNLRSVSSSIHLHLSYLKPEEFDTIDSTAVAIGKLLRSINHLTELRFILGDCGGRASRGLLAVFRNQLHSNTSPWAHSLTVLEVDEHTFPIIGLCSNLNTLTVHLGSAKERPTWPTALSVNHLRIKNTCFCLTDNGGENALATAMPNVKHLEILDCEANLPDLLTHHIGFRSVQSLNIFGNISNLGIGVDPPHQRFMCGTGLRAYFNQMTEQQRAEEFERNKLKQQRRNLEIQSGLNNLKRLAQTTFPQLRQLKVVGGAQPVVHYHLDRLPARHSLQDLDNLKPFPDVDLSRLH